MSAISAKRFEGIPQAKESLICDTKLNIFHVNFWTDVEDSSACAKMSDRKRPNVQYRHGADDNPARNEIKTPRVVGPVYGAKQSGQNDILSEKTGTLATPLSNTFEDVERGEVTQLSGPVVQPRKSGSLRQVIRRIFSKGTDAEPLPLLQQQAGSRLTENDAHFERHVRPEQPAQAERVDLSSIPPRSISTAPQRSRRENVTSMRSQPLPNVRDQSQTLQESATAPKPTSNDVPRIPEITFREDPHQQPVHGSDEATRNGLSLELPRENGQRLGYSDTENKPGLLAPMPLQAKSTSLPRTQRLPSQHRVARDSLGDTRSRYSNNTTRASSLSRGGTKEETSDTRSVHGQNPDDSPESNKTSEGRGRRVWDKYTGPRQAMEMASYLARVEELEARMDSVEKALVKMMRHYASFDFPASANQDSQGVYSSRMKPNSASKLVTWKPPASHRSSSPSFEELPPTPPQTSAAAQAFPLPPSSKALFDARDFSNSSPSYTLTDTRRGRSRTPRTDQPERHQPQGALKPLNIPPPLNTLEADVAALREELSHLRSYDSPTPAYPLAVQYPTLRKKQAMRPDEFISGSDVWQGAVAQANLPSSRFSEYSDDGDDRATRSQRSRTKTFEVEHGADDDEFRTPPQGVTPSRAEF